MARTTEPDHRGRRQPDHAMDEFDYFMIRIRRPRSGPMEPSIAGVVERLGTGEKWSFGSGEELLRVVGGRMPRIGNMQILDTAGKPTVS